MMMIGTNSSDATALCEYQELTWVLTATKHYSAGKALHNNARLFWKAGHHQFLVESVNVWSLYAMQVLQSIFHKWKSAPYPSFSPRRGQPQESCTGTSASFLYSKRKNIYGMAFQTLLTVSPIGSLRTCAHCLAMCHGREWPHRGTGRLLAHPP